MKLVEFKRNGEYIYEPGVDMAMQGYVRDNIFIDEDIILPYTTDPQVQIGRYQNTNSEINMDYIEENGIKVSRRETGGGAIYLDRGNTSFCFLKEGTTEDLDFAKLYQPVIEALHNLGATDVELNGRNDLTINGKKVSGMAGAFVNDRIYYGFSLQLDVDVESMVHALNPNRKKLEAKGVKSVRSRVESIRPHLDPEYQDLTPKEFHDLMTAKLMGLDDLSQADTYELSDEQWAEIDKECDEKWLNWDWVFGQSPRMSAIRTERIEGVGTIEVNYSVNNNKISEMSIFGDFFGSEPIENVEKALIGIRYTRSDLTAVLSEMDLAPYFKSQIDKELVDILLS